MQLSDLVKKYIEIAFGNQRSAEAFISELESSDSLPSGGNTGQLLTKQSNVDGDARTSTKYLKSSYIERTWSWT